VNDASWLLLESQDPRYVLPDDLRDSDVFAGRDVGWVEQMRPFIAAFSRPGDLVLDPFAGFGTTLVAAALEGRRGLGIEVAPDRARRIGERLARLALPPPDVRVGDCIALTPSLPRVDLVATSVPYFGCTGGLAGGVAQRYADPDYATWLERMRLTFKALVPSLARGGHLIVMVENVRVGGHFVPQAWDVARLLAERFVMQDERVIIYPGRPPHGDDPAITNRAHEYALIARHAPRAIDLDATVAALLEIERLAGMVVYGSFANYLRTGAGSPADADVLVAPDADITRIVRHFEECGFRITRWGEPLAPAPAPAAMRSGYYLLAERLDREGRLCRIDVAVADAATWDAHAGRTALIRGLRVDDTGR
jgi:hypothetical protein